MLDGRYYRTAPKVDTLSMLGNYQKKWLFEVQKQSTATFKILCSPVPWDFRTKGDSLDTWNGFKAEREEIFSFIAENRLSGVILMSADGHRSNAWRIEHPNQPIQTDEYDFYEFNFSRLTHQHVHKTMLEAIFSYNEKQSFSLVDSDTTRQPPIATYKVANLEEQIVETLELSLDQLRF